MQVLCKKVVKSFDLSLTLTNRAGYTCLEGALVDYVSYYLCEVNPKNDLIYMVIYDFDINYCKSCILMLHFILMSLG